MNVLPGQTEAPLPAMTRKPLSLKYHSIIPDDARLLFLAWSMRAGRVRPWEDQETWIPLGRLGPLLVIGNSDLSKPTPVPEYLAQCIHLSPELHADLLRRFAENGELGFDPDEFDMAVNPRPYRHQDRSNDMLALMYISQALIHRKVETDSLIELTQKQQVARAELPRGYASALTALRELLPFVDPRPLYISYELNELVPKSIKTRYPMVVLDHQEHAITIGTCTDNHQALHDDLAAETNGTIDRVEFVVCEPSALQSVIRSAGLSMQTRAQVQAIRLKKAPSVAMESVSFRHAIDPDEARQFNFLSRSATAEEIFDWAIAYGVDANASDVHFECADGYGRIRFRVDGEMKPVLQPPLELMRGITQVAKNHAGMQANNFDCQDSAFAVRIGEDIYKFRASAVPATRFGTHNVVFRILPKQLPIGSIWDMDLASDELDLLAKSIRQPKGLIVISGPTGSGKTTTLYSMLQEINTPAVNIKTVEDPIEYEVDGIIQSEVDVERGATFPRLMRTFLRQDPDVILLGEARDRESAEIAVEASLTGHLVLTTTHALSAEAAVARLTSDPLNISPYSLSESLLLLIAQRLVKRLSTTHRRPVPLSPEDRLVFESEGICETPDVIFEPERDAAGDPLYAGRLATMELVPARSEIVNAVRQGRDSHTIRTIANRFGHRTIFQNALHKVVEGRTSMREALRWRDLHRA